MSPTEYRASFPPASEYALIPTCVLRAYGRPQYRTFREDNDAAPSEDEGRSVDLGGIDVVQDRHRTGVGA
jgi:hypothetical protein